MRVSRAFDGSEIDSSAMTVAGRTLKKVIPTPCIMCWQVVGTHGASITWNKALADAKTRCYKGYPGYLAMIGSYEENKFISDLVAAAPTFETTDYAWIGGTDTQTEGEYAWIGPQKLSDGIVFWKDDESFDGSYTNWAPDEPNEGGATGMGEDCVEMSFWTEDVYGKWNDMSCYKVGPAFFISCSLNASSRSNIYDSVNLLMCRDKLFSS